MGQCRKCGAAMRSWRGGPRVCMQCAAAQAEESRDGGYECRTCGNPIGFANASGFCRGCKSDALASKQASDRDRSIVAARTPEDAEEIRLRIDEYTRRAECQQPLFLIPFRATLKGPWRDVERIGAA